MANLVRINSQGDWLRLILDDGSTMWGYPIGVQQWVVSGSGGGGVDPDPQPGSGEFVQPFPWSAVSSEYGPRSGVGVGTFHEGTDWGGGAVGGVGTDIKSIGDGVVTESYDHANFGNMVIVDHGTITTGSLAGKQVKSLSAHLVNPGLSVGSACVAGSTVLGGVGNTGASEGAHLHLEIHVMEPGGNIVWNTQNNGGFRTAMDSRVFFAEYGS